MSSSILPYFEIENYVAQAVLKLWVKNLSALVSPSNWGCYYTLLCQDLNVFEFCLSLPNAGINKNTVPSWPKCNFFVARIQLVLIIKTWSQILGDGS